MNYVLGIDLGTSGVKCLLISEEGNILGSASKSYKPDFGQNGYVEQDPSVWWENTKAAIKDIIARYPDARGKVMALSCSGQMHSSVFLDKDGNVIRKAILWNDTRTTSQTKEIYEMAGGLESVLGMVYNKALEGFTLPKILWLRENEPLNFKKVSKVIMPKDYINYMLTGNIKTEVSDAAGTLLFDVKNSRWSSEMLEKMSLNKDILPEVLQSTDVVGLVSDDISDELGLAKDAKVIAGGADNSCAAVGNGVITKGQAVLSVGTSGTAIGYLDGINGKVTGDVHLFNYSMPDSLYAMGCMLCAGEALNWLKRTFFADNSFDELNALADASPAGSDGIIFLPYLFGERCPYSDANARGVFFGISGGTEKGDMIRAVMEGVAFGLKDLFTLVTDFVDVNEVYITGGGAKSKVWGQIIADVVNRELKVLNIEEGPSFGAALIALVGAGMCPDFETAKGKSVKVIKTIKPGENVLKYDSIHKLYKELYTANKEAFKKLQEI